VDIAIASNNARLLYIDPELHSYIQFIQDIINTNFSKLKIREYTVSVSSVKFFFYRPTEHIILIFFSQDETTRFRRLLGFENQLNEYGKLLEVAFEGKFQPLVEPPINNISFQSIPPTVEEYIPDDQELLDIIKEPPQKEEDRIEEKSETEEEEYEFEAELWKIPFFTRKIKKKQKFPIYDSMVLNFINNENTVEEIMEKSEKSKEFVENVIEKYQRKGLVDVRFVEPEIMETENFIYPRLKKPVSFSIGFRDDEKAVLQNCSGDLTIQDIAKKTSIAEIEVVKILDKYEDEGVLDFKVEGTPDYYPKNLKKVNPMGVQLGLISPQEFKIRQMCTGVVSLKAISKSLDIAYDELLASLKKMEEKGDIILKIRKI